MYFVLKSAVRSLMLPPSAPLILAVIGAVMLWRRRRFGGVILAVALSSLWVLSTPVVAEMLWHVAERYPALDVAKPTAAQAIVIIGGGGTRQFAPEYGGPAAEFGLLTRLGYGAYVSRKTGLPILVSGAPLEAPVMRTSLERDFGVAARWTEDQSRDTYENARFTAHLLRADGIRHIILITSSTHMWRAAHEFQDAGFDVVAAPEGVWAPRKSELLQFIPNPAALMRSHSALYELIGEQARRVQSALGVREMFDKKARG